MKLRYLNYQCNTLNNYFIFTDDLDINSDYYCDEDYRCVIDMEVDIDEKQFQNSGLSFDQYYYYER